MRQFNQMIKIAREVQDGNDPILAGNSVAAHALRQMVALAAQTADAVCLTGADRNANLEIARAIHSQSEWADEPFVDASDHGFNEDHFAIRWEGTLFVGDATRLAPLAQRALLDWMESADGALVRVIFVRCEMVSPGLGNMIAELEPYLSKLVINCPALAKRKDDIPLMLQRLWVASPHPLPPIFERDAWSQLAKHHWNGDFTELLDFVEKASRLHGGRRLTADHVGKLLGHRIGRELARAGFSLKQHLAQEEKLFIIEALLRSNGIVQEAAHMAGINRTTFLAKMQRHGLSRV